jgi:hypothetical protein
MANVTIDPVASNTTRRGMRSKAWTSADVGYRFFIDSDSLFKYLKTTDGGLIWSGLTTVCEAGETILAYDIWFDRWTPGDSGSLIHFWHFGTVADDVIYRTLDTSGDSLSTPVVVFAGVSAAADIANFVSGTKAKGGNLLCAFCIDDGTEMGTYRSTDGGQTWAARTNMVESTPGNDHFAMLFPANLPDSQDIWALYQDTTSHELTVKTHDDSANTNAESSAIPCMDNGIAEQLPFQFSGAIRHSDGNLLFAVLTDFDVPTGDFLTYEWDGTTLTQKGTLATDKANIGYPSLMVDDFTGYVYLAYIGKRDGSEELGVAAAVYYARSADGMATWPAGDTPYSEGLGDWRQLWGAPNGPRFQVSWRDVSSQELLTNFDNSLAFPASPVRRGSFPPTVWAG